MKKTLKKLLAGICVVAAMASMMLVTTSASTKDYEFFQTKGASNTWYNSPVSTKENKSYVYVYPKVSPTGYLYVSTYGLNGSTWVNYTDNGNQVKLTAGKEYGVSNWIFEVLGKCSAKIRYNQGSDPFKKTEISGFWSADSIDTGLIKV